MRLSLVIAIASMLAALPALSKPAAKKAAASACVECHTRVTPGIVTQHAGSAHAKSGEVDCATCHGGAHVGMDDAAKAVMPSPATCKECHEEQVAQYAAGKPGLNHQPVPVKGAGMKGCSGCHKIGDKDAAKAGVHYGTGACDSCHTRHSFSKAEARDPRACQTCHMGFDHPQWEMWSSSKHGTIWQVEGGKGGRAPTCQDCHMQGGDHRAMTAWGFLAVRLPEDDAEWMADRVEILKALGVLDKVGQPTARLDVVKAGKVARLSKEEFQAERSKMEKTCAKCHSPAYAKEQLAAGDRMVRESDRVFAAAIREVRALYDDGVLSVPAGWTTAPDLLQFQDAKTPIELDLYKMFMEYRMRAFQGAFHNNPDYTQWYGWAPLVETLTRVKAEAARLRAEHKPAKRK